jgi:hypothetical protein
MPARGLMTFESLGLASQVGVGTGATLMRSPANGARSICHLSLTCAPQGPTTNYKRQSGVLIFIPRAVITEERVAEGDDLAG